MRDLSTGGYQNKKICKNRKGLTSLRLFKGQLKGNIRNNQETSRT